MARKIYFALTLDGCNVCITCMKRIQQIVLRGFNPELHAEMKAEAALRGVRVVDLYAEAAENLLRKDWNNGKAS